MKRILITGGNGYIGENLIKRYQGKGFNFHISDYENTKLPLAHVLNFEDIESYDGVVHLAALSGLAACEEYPNLAIQENVLTANNIFNLSLISRIPVVFTSSQAAKDPESSKYACIKWICEGLANYYNDLGGSNYVLRLSNVYGGYSYLTKKNTCVKQFITKYKKNEPLIVHGDGSQTRDFIHVYDVCDAIIKTLEHEPLDKTPMDIGTGIETSIIQLKNMFPNTHNVFEEVRNVGVGSSIADIETAKERINFKAKNKIENYIKECVKNG